MSSELDETFHHVKTQNLLSLFKFIIWIVISYYQFIFRTSWSLVNNPGVGTTELELPNGLSYNFERTMIQHGKTT